MGNSEAMAEVEDARGGGIEADVAGVLLGAEGEGDVACWIA